VPVDKMPNDFFSIGLAEVLIMAGKTEEGVTLVKEIIDYSKSYLDYAISINPGERYGLDYPTGINMQGLLDIYNMSMRLKLDSLTKIVEPEITKYYGALYSAN